MINSKSSKEQAAVLSGRKAGSWWSDFSLLTKFRLSALVVFSAVMSYASVALENTNWVAVSLLTVGGFLVTGASNALNQVLERDYDGLMTRTANRPLVTSRMTVSGAVLLAGLMALVGISMLSVFNPLTGFLGTLSLISYAFVYTPLKRITPLAVAVGAFPGALPNMIGCVAFEGHISDVAWMLFLMQVLWQFPHFWAVAWLADEDYKRAGFNLLPTSDGRKDESVGRASLLVCLLLIPNAMLGWGMGMYSVGAMGLLVLLSAHFSYTCYRLYRDCSREAARKQMFTSFFYLPAALGVILLDRLFF
jgi:heme o synthase